MLSMNDKIMDYQYPFNVRISFKSIFKHFEDRYRKEDSPLAKKYIEQFLSYFDQYPILKDSIEDFDIIKKYETQISFLFDDLFPNMLTKNEIKAACRAQQEPPH